MAELGLEESLPQEQYASDVLTNPSSPAYVSPDSLIMDIGTGRDGYIPMSPAFYMFSTYLREGRLWLSDMPLEEGSKKKGIDGMLLGLFGLPESIHTIHQYNPALLRNISMAEFDFFGKVPDGLPKFDILFDHLTSWDWLMKYHSLGRMNQTDIGLHIGNRFSDLLKDKGKALLYHHELTRQELPQQTALLAGLTQAGFTTKQVGPIIDSYKIDNEVMDFTRTVRRMKNCINGYVNADGFIVPSHNLARYIIVAEKK